MATRADRQLSGHGARRWLCLALLLSACAWWPPSSGQPALDKDSRIAMSVTLSAGYLHLQVLVAPRCRAADAACPEGRPMSELAVGVRTARGDHALGQTWRDGGLDVSFSQLEPLFPAQAVKQDERAPLLVEGRVVAELPIGEIWHRQRIIESAVQECDQALADRQLDSDYAQSLLGRMLDLQLLGMGDERIKARATQLSERIRAQPGAMWSTPQPGAARAGELMADLRARRQAESVPTSVQDDIARGLGNANARQSFEWALEWLPTMCTVTIKGGAIAGQVALTGTPGVALAIIGATVGHVFSDWMIASCCQKLGKALGAARPPECT